MSNPGNDNWLEQLSREAAGAYTPPGTPSWEKMEAALDKVLPVEEKKRRRFIFWWLFPLVLTGAGLVYSVWPEPAAVQPEQPLSTTTPSPAPVVQSESPTENPQELTDDQQSAVTKETNTNSNIITTSDAKNMTAGKNKKVGIQEATVSSSAHKQVPITSTNKQQQLQTTFIIQVIPPVTVDTAQKTADPLAKINTTNNTIVNTIQPMVDSGSNKTGNGIIEQTDSITSQSKVIQPDPLQTDSTISTTKKTTNSKFSIAFVAGIDASTVKYKYTDKAGFNVGILAGYHFNEHWSVHTGVLYTKKNYTVAGEDFNAPKNSWIANYKLTIVDGFCNMWEVPLFARYQFNTGSKRSFFLGAGISSYIMTRENYNYSYYFNGQPVTRNNNYPNGNTYLFSILRLSGGWSKSIGRGSSILVDPYAALPLAGVGFGSIRLSSFGLNFSFQFRQPSKKK